MIISNHSLDNVALRLSPLPPQHQNLAPPPLEATDIRDSVLLSREEQSREQTLQASPPPLTELSSDNSQNTTEASEPNQVKTRQKHLPTEEREPQCRSRPESYSAATSTDCAFSSEAAPALLFQEDFYAAWPLDNSNSNNSQPESTAPTESATSSESITPAVSIKTESQTATVASSSSTRSKAEAKKAPTAEGPSSQAEEQAIQKEKEQQERQRVEVIYDRIKAERLLHEAKRQAIWADLQTELRRIWREVMLRRKKSEDDYQKNWQKIFLNAG